MEETPLLAMNLRATSFLFISFLLTWQSFSALIYDEKQARPRPPLPLRPPPPPLPPPPPPPQRPGPKPPRPQPPSRCRNVRCRLPSFPDCFQVSLPCPPDCPSTCLMDCTTCRPVCNCDSPGAVCQDPRFVGGDGNTFYFHGHKDKDFCLVSDSEFHINGHFIGKRNPNMKRDFTWVQSIGVLFNTHKVYIGANKTSIWEDDEDHLHLTFDGTPISLPSEEGIKWESKTTPNALITRTSLTNRISVEVEGRFRVNVLVVPIGAEESRIHKYNITKDDCFAHLELGFKFYNLTDSVDGVLGQTYGRNYVNKAKVGAPMPLMGGEEKFSTSDIFSTDCLASKFGQLVLPTSNDAGEFADMLCGSGGEEVGMICKK